MRAALVVQVSTDACVGQRGAGLVRQDRAGAKAVGVIGEDRAVLVKEHRSRALVGYDTALRVCHDAVVIGENCACGIVQPRKQGIGERSAVLIEKLRSGARVQHLSAVLVEEIGAGSGIDKLTARLIRDERDLRTAAAIVIRQRGAVLVIENRRGVDWVICRRPAVDDLAAVLVVEVCARVGIGKCGAIQVTERAVVVSESSALLVVDVGGGTLNGVLKGDVGEGRVVLVIEIRARAGIGERRA